MRLTVAPLLRALVTEDRTDVVCAQRTLIEQPTLERGAHDRRGPFRAQRHAPPAAIHKRVHFLFDDIGRVADAANEEFRRLEEGRSNLAVAETVGQRADPRFERAPTPRFGRQNVLRPARCGKRPSLLWVTAHSFNRRAIQKVGALTMYDGIRDLAIAYSSGLFAPDRVGDHGDQRIDALASWIARPTA